MHSHNSTGKPNLAGKTNTKTKQNLVKPSRWFVANPKTLGVHNVLIRRGSNDRRRGTVVHCENQLLDSSNCLEPAVLHNRENLLGLGKLVETPQV